MAIELNQDVESAYGDVGVDSGELLDVPEDFFGDEEVIIDGVPQKLGDVATGKKPEETTPASEETDEPPSETDAPEDSQDEEAKELPPFQPYKVTISSLRTGETEVEIDSEDTLKEAVIAWKQKQDWQKSFTERDQKLAAERKFYESISPLVQRVQSIQPNTAEAWLMNALVQGYSAREILAAATQSNDPEPNKQEDYGGWLEWKIRQQDKTLAQRQMSVQQPTQQNNQLIQANIDVYEATVHQLIKDYGIDLSNPDDQAFFTDQMIAGIQEQGKNPDRDNVGRNTVIQAFNAKFSHLVEKQKGFEKAKQIASTKGKAVATPTRRNAGTQASSRVGRSLEERIFG